ncbi:hypothetical protein GCM10011313_21750 [Mycetocola zhadangensis]|nr:hypothetical protein GCM10011313_21750 [Mycetocola zhadangensis]
MRSEIVGLFIRANAAEVEKQLSAGRGCIERLSERPELDPSSVRLPHDGDQVSHRALRQVSVPPSRNQNANEPVKPILHYP